MKEAAKKRREKQDELDAKARIRAKIEADKAERRAKAEKEKAEREGRAAAIPAAAPPASPAVPKPATAYTETRLRLQTPSGNVMKTFPVETTLFEVAAALNQENGLNVQNFAQNFPRKIFDSEYFGETLKELGLVPSASLVVN